ncbi:uncharacterized protein CcaverHIS019_0511690 [Cutaneotrichosporon cavernicola]|uniref:Uncharacterized protein n=1 Tax=Cutaneotrichosporon cavernicola TaxID=279322 RepID=A0AA48QXM3_9TREE|nr:uncharacterized protein CcaverHIS019_0511690 [Cutaneotrichosporon cavernicola]BEI93541.1 hypothetical protein CcaverHIS019_0511690 [Cutaneotrichosporon cavernicola]
MSLSTVIILAQGWAEQSGSTAAPQVMLSASVGLVRCAHRRSGERNRCARRCSVDRVARAQRAPDPGVRSVRGASSPSPDRQSNRAGVQPLLARLAVSVGVEPLLVRLAILASVQPLPVRLASLASVLAVRASAQPLQRLAILAGVQRLHASPFGGPRRAGVACAPPRRRSVRCERAAVARVAVGAGPPSPYPTLSSYSGERAAVAHVAVPASVQPLHASLFSS